MPTPSAQRAEDLTPSQEALLRACSLVKGQERLAERIGTTQSQIWYWLWRSKKGVAAEFCMAIERETGVGRSELRPDIWPPETSTTEPADANEVA
jgi:DNA-binding transcriptional regulator YdaS (Cro superfamily)